MASVAHQIRSLRALGIGVDVLEIKGLPRVKYLQCLPRVRRLAPDVDLIHAHFGFSGWLARCQNKRPVVVSFMGDDLLGTPDGKGRVTRASRFAVALNRLMARVVDAVIVKSAEMARVVAPVRAHVVPNGVDLELFRPIDPATCRQQLEWPDGRYVLFAGDPDNPRKGFPLARQAVDLASSEFGTPLTLVPLKQVPLAHVPHYMNACEAVLLTSFIEGSPNVVKEAMACNLPVIAVPVGDVAEQLAGVENCVVVPRDPAVVAAALVKALTSARRSNGRAVLIARGLDNPSVAKRIVSIYGAVIAARREGAAETKPIGEETC